MLLLGEPPALREAHFKFSAHSLQDTQVSRYYLPHRHADHLAPVQAALAPFESVERLTLVAAFAISMYNTIKRVQKPFKNLQQSTYELVYPEKGIRAIGEKVRLPLLSIMTAPVATVVREQFPGLLLPL